MEDRRLRQFLGGDELGSARECEPDLVDALAQRQLDVLRRPGCGLQDEEAGQGARVAPEG